MNHILRFLLIDDDPFNNFLSRALIHHLDSSIPAESFRDPDDAIRFIEANFSPEENRQTIILLDINLPRLSGWDFIEKLKKQPERVRSRFDIYILSSFIDGRDKQRVAANSIIKGYMQKPLEKELLTEAIAARSLQRAG
jgi:response regulator RpfG family c-di-GMP phosphodiesterase